MFKLTLFLGGSIWVAMAFAPDLDEPVFTEMVAEVAPVVEPAPETTRSALISPVEVVAPVVVSTPEPVAVAIVAIFEPGPGPERVIWFVTGSRVNLRGGPATNYEVLGKVV